MAFNRRDVDKAAQGNTYLRAVLDRIIARQCALENVLGITPDLTVPKTETNLFAAPPLAVLDVVGVNGVFQIAITNPADVKVPLLMHHLQSSETLPFEASSTLTDYNETNQLSLAFSDPNKTYYWRLQSRYPMGSWNGWQVYPQAVSSAALIFQLTEDTAITSAYADATLLCYGTHTHTLPAPTSGIRYFFINVDSGVITILGTINGDPLGYALTNIYQYVELQGDGTGWIVVANN